MRRLAFGLFVILCVGAAAFAASTLGPWAPVVEPPGIDLTGGPDAYGYTWIDSNEPGGPVYNWKNISVTGTLVAGMGDDNWVGPFPIGFPFHYYWYDITQYWIGANGFLKFGTPGPISSTFPASIPLAAVPNDFAAVYTMDYDLTVGGQCYRWNNADSLVVSWINVPAWSFGGSHTFQVIMSRLDSAFTYQYGAQAGTTQNDDILIGIENVNGLVGLERAHDVYMLPNYAIYWNSPSTTTYQAHDLAAWASGNANSEGFFVISGNAVTPYAKVKNVGNQTEASFTVNCTIQQTGGGTVYNQTVTQGPLAPGAELQVNFSPNWVPVTTAQYIMRITVNLTGDMNPLNNQKNCEVHVLTVPGTLLYDDGIVDQGLIWTGGNGGFGQRFVPPSYPVVVDSIRYFISTTSGGVQPFIARVLDDDGPNGLPGTVLFSQNIATPTGNMWYGTVANVTITSGAFYVAWVMQDSAAYLGMDTTLAMGSRQCYELTGGWSISRDAETTDAMIRAKIMPQGGVPNVTVALIPYGTPIIIPLQGGSFSYNIAAHNGEATSQTFQAWGMVTLPNGNPYGPVLGPATVTLAPGATINRDRTQNVPGNAPSGNYLYNAHVGTYPTPIWNSASFPFTKSAAGDGGAWVGDWANTGESFEASATVAPASFALEGNHPNPFNPTTTISFALPEASQVTLTVYDVQGQVVAQLVNGWRDAGSHSTTFDGTNLASGIYLYHLTAGSFDATGKMVLMK